MAGVRNGQRALDLACGTGCAALLQRLGPDGALLGLDLSPEMVEIARRWAHQQGLHRVTFRAINAETQLGVAPCSFDIATCLFGLMYMPEPVPALHALGEALVPGGRLAVCTWSSLERCPFLGVPLTIIRRHVSHPMLHLTGPHPFAIPTETALAGLISAAGFTAIRTATMQRPVDPLSPEQYWDYMEATGWPLAFLPPLAASVRQPLRDDMIATLATMFPDDRVQLSGEAILAVAERPE
jgi:ubiquinone/menaquinone biosynthesis C-methylase UbiE